MNILNYFQRAVLLLLASSRFKRDDLEFLSLPLIHEAVYRLFSLTTPLALLPGLLVSHRMGQTGVMVVQGVVEFVVVLHAYLLLSRNYRLLSPFMMFSVSIALYLLAISRGEIYTVYFGSAFTVSFYLLLDRENALKINLLWLVLNGAIAYFIFEPPQSTFLFGNLATTTFFIEILFFILKKNEKHLKHMAERDPLTNAFNRRKMVDELDFALSHAARYKQPASIIILDIDNFKQINDSHGHSEGDTVLVALADLLRARLRNVDRLYRYGGEEFVILLPSTDIRAAKGVAEDLCQRVRQSTLSTKSATTISCGVAESGDKLSVDSWIDRCDEALYLAKSGGRDQVRLEYELAGDSELGSPTP